MKKSDFLCLALIAVLGVVVYSNSLQGQFIWDDAGLVKNNIYIRSWPGFSRIFTENSWAGSGENSTVYRPLQMVTYAADYFLWKLDPRGYHLTNILLHVLAALSLYWFVIALFNQRLLALFSSLLFISHPVHTEAVSYISGRADPLAAIFILLSFVFYLKSLRSANLALLVAALLGFVFAILSRESALIFPVLLLLYHYAFRKKLESRSFLPFLGIAAIYILFRMVFMATLFYDTPVQTTLLQRLPGFFVAITGYLRILFFPFILHMEYGRILFGFLTPMAMLGVAAIIFLLFCLLRTGRSNPLVFFSISWFLIALFPASNLYPINSYMAEHWLYLPSIGFFLLLGQGFLLLYERKGCRFLATGLLIVLLAAYSCMTVIQNDYWRDELGFYERTLEYAPHSCMVHNNLGNLYTAMGNKAGAIEEYRKALKLNPRYDAAYSSLCGLYNDLAADYVDMGNKNEAIRLWNEAVRINPGFAVAHFNLAVYYLQGKQYDLALAHCDKVLELGYHIGPKLLKELEPFRAKGTGK